MSEGWAQAADTSSPRGQEQQGLGSALCPAPPCAVVLMGCSRAPSPELSSHLERHWGIGNPRDTTSCLQGRRRCL